MPYSLLIKPRSCSIPTWRITWKSLRCHTPTSAWFLPHCRMFPAPLYSPTPVHTLEQIPQVHMPHYRQGAVYMDAPLVISQMHGEAALTPFAVPIPITQDPPTVDVLTAGPPEERVEVLRDRQFPLIQKLNPGHAMKITDIILKLDFAKVLNMLENTDALSHGVEEAIKLPYRADTGEEENGGVEGDEKKEESEISDDVTKSQGQNPLK